MIIGQRHFTHGARQHVWNAKLISNTILQKAKRCSWNLGKGRYSWHSEWALKKGSTIKTIKYITWSKWNAYLIPEGGKGGNAESLTIIIQAFIDSWMVPKDWIQQTSHMHSIMSIDIIPLLQDNHFDLAGWKNLKIIMMDRISHPLDKWRLIGESQHWSVKDESCPIIFTTIFDEGLTREM